MLHRENIMTDRSKSIEVLEQDVWAEPAFHSSVVCTCHRARKKPLYQLSGEEIRCLIGQKTGLKYVIPLALERLQSDPLTEVTFYPGDLLAVMLRLDPSDWEQNPDELQAFRVILKNSHKQIECCGEIPQKLLTRWL